MPIKVKEVSYSTETDKRLIDSPEITGGSTADSSLMRK